MRKPHLLIQAATFVVAIVLWETVVSEGYVDPLFLPAPTKIFFSLISLHPATFAALYDTLLKTLVSFSIGSVAGVAIGIVVGSRSLLHDVLYPYIFGLYSIPRMVFLPLIVLFLGIGFNSTIFYAVLHTFLPVIIVVVGGVKNIDRRQILYAISLGATGRQIYSKVIIPAALPSILAALRLGIIFSLLGILIAEMYLSLSGVGFLMQKLSFAFRSADLFAVTIVVALLAIVISAVLGEVSKKIEERR
jgi:NitT/TauT family transport system permease protein